MQDIMVHLDRCNGCLMCTLACAAAHSASGSITQAMAEGVQSRLFIEAAGSRPVPVMCRHCEEPVCVEACMAGAMQKDPDTGIVTNEGHEQSCVGCWMCIMVCPYGAITPKKGEARMALKCDRCQGRDEPACVAACPNRALVLTEAGAYAEGRRKITACTMAG